jgi:O-antigen/teichoic acid export membrane protein
MLLSTLITLYTSRVVLDMLGVEDFGIYALVGGVVAMLGFLNAAMSGATSRFLTFELAKGNSERLRDTFNSAMIIHIGIALLVFVVAETAGLWFVNTQLVIPEERLVAANWAYQFSAFAAMVGITQVPYNADIIANEKMDIYAYVEMLNVGLKLGVVYLLVIGVFDKLILYALLILCVSIIIAMIYRVYCLRHFQESRLRWVWDITLLKPMLAFSGWDL